MLQVLGRASTGRGGGFVSRSLQPAQTATLHRTPHAVGLERLSLHRPPIRWLVGGDCQQVRGLRDSAAQAEEHRATGRQSDRSAGFDEPNEAAPRAAGVRSRPSSISRSGTTDASAIITRANQAVPMSLLGTRCWSDPLIFKQVTDLGGWGNAKFFGMTGGAVVGTIPQLPAAQNTFHAAHWAPGLLDVGGQKFERAFAAKYRYSTRYLALGRIYRRRHRHRRDPVGGVNRSQRASEGHEFGERRVGCARRVYDDAAKRRKQRAATSRADPKRQGRSLLEVNSDPSGGFHKVWSSAKGKDDEPGLVSGLQKPEGPAFDKAGNLYVTEMGNGQISKITPDGARTVLATTGGSPNGARIRTRWRTMDHQRQSAQTRQDRHDRHQDRERRAPCSQTSKESHSARATI